MKRDHPRVCGEKLLSVFVDSVRIGSPPRMRGKGFATLTYDEEHGITPAYAGKSRHCRRPLLRRRDHPRVCGEKVLRIHPRRNSVGSPPRMRGKVDIPLFPDAFFGITPAYAGKSKYQRCQESNRKDHPRVCGEKQSILYLTMRLLRITPAYAGKSDSNDF